MSVKDILQSLVDDGMVETEKIGTSVYFWAFPSKASQNVSKSCVVVFFLFVCRVFGMHTIGRFIERFCIEYLHLGFVNKFSTFAKKSFQFSMFQGGAGMIKSILQESIPVVCPAL